MMGKMDGKHIIDIVFFYEYDIIKTLKYEQNMNRCDKIVKSHNSISRYDKSLNIL